MRLLQPVGDIYILVRLHKSEITNHSFSASSLFICKKYQIETEQQNHLCHL